MNASSPTRRRGVALLGLLLGVLFIGVLMVLFLNGGGGILGMPAGMTPLKRIEQTRDMVCEMNRRTLTGEIILGDLSSMRNVDPAVLQQRFGSRRTCPGEGKCYFADGEIYCTLHTPTPRFRDAILQR